MKNTSRTKTLNGIDQEIIRNEQFLHLTANENQMSPTALKYLGASIANRYYFGGGDEDSAVASGNFMGLGFKNVEKLLTQATEAAKKMLGATSVNLNLLSGVHAMMSAILSTTEPGDLVLTVHLAAGGHFATAGILKRVGRKQAFIDYDLTNLKFDIEKTAKKVKELNAKAIYLDVSYYINAHNLTELRQAVGPDVIIIYDASHTIGLIMGQQFQNPFLEGAEVVCANTHKTLPGPHKGMIAFKNKELAEKAENIINGCLYSTLHITHLIALSITILEMEEFGQEYAKQIIANSQALGKKLVELGYEVRKANNGRYSTNHQVHVFIDNPNLGDSLTLYKRLLANKISTNFDAPLGGRLFIRLGTQEITRRGFKEQNVEYLAEILDQALKGKDVKKEVEDLIERFNTIYYC